MQGVGILVFHQGDGLVGNFRSHIFVLLLAQHTGQHVLGGNQLGVGLFVQAHLGLQAEDAGQRFGHTLFGDRTGLIGVHHNAVVFVGVVEEQVHIAAGVDGLDHHFLMGQAIGHAHHVGSVGDHEAVEAQLVAEQTGHDLIAQGGGQHFVVRGTVHFAHILGQHDVAAHNAVQAVVDQVLIDLAIGSHPLVLGELVHIGGKVGITEILAIAGEVLGHAGIAVVGVHTVHVGLGHVHHAVHVVAVGAVHNFGVFPVVMNISHRSEGHVVAHGGSFFVAHTAHFVGILGVAGGADLNAAADVGTIDAGAVAAGLCVAGHKQRDAGIFLQHADLVLGLGGGDAVVAVTANVVLGHPFHKLFVGNFAEVIKEQLADLFFVGHGSNGVLHPLNVFIRQAIGNGFQIYHGSHSLKTNLLSLE